MPPPSKKRKRAKNAVMWQQYYRSLRSIAKTTESTDTFLNHPSDCAQTQQYDQNVSEIENENFVPQSAEEYSFTNDSINTNRIEKPNECHVKLKNMPKCSKVYAPKKVDPRQCKNIAETRKEQDVLLLKQCSTTSDINGQLNENIMERLNENCANCGSNFKHENERNVKFKTIQHNPFAKSNEIEIIDAIFYIYGLTVADWSKTLALDHESDFTSTSEIVFSNGVTFCHKCTSVLENIYTSHKSLKELAHDGSLFSKTLNKKYSCEVQNKIECDDETETSSLNNSDLSDEELEFKEEDDSEEILIDFQDSNSEINYELDDPLMEDTLDEQCIVPIKTSLQRPKKILLHHPFSISCCDESFVSKKAYANHHLKSHSTDMDKPKLVKCGICEILIPKDNVDIHMDTYYMKVWKNYFNCKICNTQFESASAMTEHLQTHDPKYATLICNICEAPMQSDFQLLIHKSQNHSESETSRVCICDICEAPMQSDFQLLLHKLKNHSESETSRVCIVCEKLFPSWNKLRGHMKRMHEEKPDDYKYICVKCDSMFDSEFFLSLHRKQSINCRITKKRSVCEKCGKSIITAKMKKHLRLHDDIECSNKELFRCPQCGKILKHHDSLKKHIRREHPVEEKLFFCEKCGKTTKNMTNMRIHMKVHEKE